LVFVARLAPNQAPYKRTVIDGTATPL
jgi:hypothetical protein